MISWWWIIVAFILGLVNGYHFGDLRAINRCYNKLKDDLDITAKDIELSEARLEVLWLSKTLEDIATYPHMPCPDSCKAERWREDANEWAKKIIEERIKEKVNE